MLPSLQCAGQTEAQHIAETLERFIRTHFRVPDNDRRFSRSVHLFEEGYVDSIGAVELISFVESEFDLTLPETTLFSDEFTSIAGISRCLASAMSASAHSFCIEHNKFDSGVLADKVAEVTILDVDKVPAGLETEIVTQLRAKHYDYAFVKASQRLPFEHFDFMGELNDLQAEISSVAGKLKAFSKKVTVSSFDPSHWSQIGDLLKYASATRYSRDPHVSEDALTELKMKLLKVYFERNPELTRIVKDHEGGIIGFLNAYLTDSDSTLCFYEIVTHPDYRRGFVALNLLQSVVQKARGLTADLNRVKTSVYADNENSLAMFKAIGLLPFASHYFYHYWISHE